MAREVWLRSNRRLWTILAVLPVAGLVVAPIFMLSSSSAVVTSFAAGAMAACFIALSWLAWQWRKPRLVYANGQLEVFLARKPISIPIEIVEVFFMGQGPSFLPPMGVGESKGSPDTANLIVRLAESEPDWKHRDVWPRLGQWCEGYITIRGAFCEPLSKEVAGRLNHRLIEVHRERSKSRQLESV